jgi:dipeptidyl aminopeptidase/acylaminoacyl peptidase
MDAQQRRGRFGAAERGVYKAQISPHWFQDGAKFWYRNDLRDGAKEFVVVDAEKGSKSAAFDHQKLAASLSKASGKEYSSDKLPFSEIEFIEDGKALSFTADEKKWRCDLATYECKAGGDGADARPFTGLEALFADGDLPSHPTDADVSAGPGIPATDSEPWITEFSPPSPEAVETNQPVRPNAQGGARRARPREQRDEGAGRKSPDGKWTATVKDHNVYFRAEGSEEDLQATQDGQETNSYGRLEWSPDSKSLVAWRIEPGDHKEVYLIRSSPPGGGRATFSSRPYDLPGDKLTLYEVNILDPVTRKEIKPEVDRYEHGWETPRLHWNKDKQRFCYMKVDRGHQRLRVVEVNCQNGAVRNVVDEKTDTFIWTAHTEELNLSLVNWLENTDEMIYVSERDGWRHLYLVDLNEGKIVKQITRGEYVIRGIDRIDEEKRQVWFRACGKNAGQDPYFVHYYRVNFDGSGLVALTEGDGNHTVQYSSDRKHLVDTWSRVDSAPVHELRRASDGGLVSKFEEADISELQATGWKPPEVFVAKARDGKTDIWGTINRPKDFDPSRKYPVIEQIYAGPQGSYVPKSFGGARRFSSLTDLGFIVVQMDGMGTANRSKAFHDVCWKNLKDAGFPDRILWHKAVAAKYPWYDISRVGIYGTSAGGQNAAGAVLFHPEFYKAAVANSGCHDNRMDKASWNEQWMGYPVGPQYAESSNLENAGKLRGHLMLVVGEMDDNVPPETTYRFVDALIRANKDFDLLAVPNGGHGAGGAYGQRRLQDFFVRHLQGTEPPNRNATSQEGG